MIVRLRFFYTYSQLSQKFSTLVLLTGLRAFDTLGSLEVHQMDFMERNALIDALVRRGFKETKNQPIVGWSYRHQEDDIGVWFNFDGRYKINFEDNEQFGVTGEKEDILTIIDDIAAAL